jgi:hypothetical protein
MVVTPTQNPGSRSQIATGLRAGQSVVLLPGQAKDFCLHQNVQSDYGTHSAPYLMSNGAFSEE